MPGMRASVGPFHPLPVQRLVADAARRLPNKTAIIDGERRFTFQDLDEASGRLAVALAAMGVGKGTIVGVLAPNCAEFEIAFFGILKAGATVTTINSGYREREIAAQLNASGAETVIVHESLLEVYETAARAAPGARLAIVISEGRAAITMGSGAASSAPRAPCPTPRSTCAAIWPRSRSPAGQRDYRRASC